MVKKFWMQGQTALEYMLLTAIVAAIVLVGFQVYTPRSRTASESYYNNLANAIMGEAPPPSKTE